MSLSKLVAGEIISTLSSKPIYILYDEVLYSNAKLAVEKNQT